MALKTCVKCKQEKSLANYIGCNSPLHTGTLPICRNCLNEMISSNKDCTWNIVDKICQWADIPFVPQEWEKLYYDNGKNALGIYFSIFRQDEYKTLEWGDYNKAYLLLKEEQRLEDAVPELKQKEIKNLRLKWGSNYAEEELYYLENLHQGIIADQNLIGSLNEDQAKKLCKISLMIEVKLRAGEPIAQDLKGYSDLIKIANFNPKTIRDGEEFESVGEVFAYLEKAGWKANYHDEEERDEIDGSLKNIQDWLRYLYVNETGIAEEIQLRIDNLKIADELNGKNFNEDEFKTYMKEFDVMEDAEEFRCDI